MRIRRGACGSARFVPYAAVRDRGEFAALDAGENTAIRADTELVQVRAEYPGQRRGHRHPPPFPGDS
jgi:hypothetical protein